MATILEMMEQEYLQGKQEGLERGIEQGKQEGIEQGIEQGGLLKAKELLIKLLERRFGPLSENERETVHNCKNQDKLESASIVLVENRTKQEVLAELV
ncbi:MAG: hypothetical protein H3C43_14425 [Leptonema sp. (in: Bacteria)]|nr:hypothetical protein [Leptonema sp. (in: bacteria)]